MTKSEDPSTTTGISRLRAGDKLLEVDGVHIEGLGYSSVLQIIGKAGDTVHFLVSQLVQ